MNLTTATAGLVLAIFGLGCNSSQSASNKHEHSVTLAPPTLAVDQPVDFAGVHNVVAYGETLFSGSAPEGIGGLESLAAMGIRTIISVDGAQPDAERAAELGMRYVHLPIGYNGIEEQRKLELARAVRDLPGPVYVHCHHGKHRSAGAAAAIGRTLGWLDDELALQRMKVSGTAPNYPGLYACATETQPASDGALNSASNEFPSHWITSGLVQSMVEIDIVIEHLKEVEKAGWRAPSSHPDLLASAEASHLTDFFRILAEDSEVQSQPTEFQQLLANSTATAAALEALLETTSPQAPETLSAAFKAVHQSCKDCHSKYRD